MRMGAPEGGRGLELQGNCIQAEGRQGLDEPARRRARPQARGATTPSPLSLTDSVALERYQRNSSPKLMPWAQKLDWLNRGAGRAGPVWLRFTTGSIWFPGRTTLLQ